MKKDDLWLIVGVMAVLLGIGFLFILLDYAWVIGGCAYNSVAAPSVTCRVLSYVPIIVLMLALYYCWRGIKFLRKLLEMSPQ
jgi:uncharacterized membrane protein